MKTKVFIVGRLERYISGKADFYIDDRNLYPSKSDVQSAYSDRRNMLRHHWVLGLGSIGQLLDNFGESSDIIGPTELYRVGSGISSEWIPQEMPRIRQFIDVESGQIVQSYDVLQGLDEVLG